MIFISIFSVAAPHQPLKNTRKGRMDIVVKLDKRSPLPPPPPNVFFIRFLLRSRAKGATIS